MEHIAFKRQTRATSNLNTSGVRLVVERESILIMFVIELKNYFLLNSNDNIYDMTGGAVVRVV